MGDTKIFDIEELDERFYKTEFFVKATAEAVNSLWYQYSRKHNLYSDKTWLVDWQPAFNDNLYVNKIYTIGSCVLDDESYSVTLDFNWACLNNVIISFWYSPSLVVHYGLINKWWERNLSNINKHDDRCIDLEFYKCLKYISEKNKKA